MIEIKWDIKRGAEIYRQVYTSRLQKWIFTGKIKKGEILVWRSGFSGWRKAEEIEELAPFFARWERYHLRRLKRKRLLGRALPSKNKIKNILIIEDEKDLCWLLFNTLSSKGYNVVTANSKKEGILSLKRERPDLVFLDLKLPDGDGMKVLSKIKKTNPMTLVNIVSAYGSEETKEEARRKGVYSFIDKPFTEKEILKSIKYEGVAQGD